MRQGIIGCNFFQINCESSQVRPCYPELQDDFSDPLIFSGAAVPPPVPWNVDETLFEIVAAVPDQDAVRD